MQSESNISLSYIGPYQSRGLLPDGVQLFGCRTYRSAIQKRKARRIGGLYVKWNNMNGSYHAISQK